jgi:hypothetical protein
MCQMNIHISRHFVTGIFHFETGCTKFRNYDLININMIWGSDIFSWYAQLYQSEQTLKEN